MKLIFVTGGVLSGLGKGITASSVGRLLKSRGLNVSAMKMDPYLNYNAGTVNLMEHGEVYVLDDGGEADLDLGNYERFIGLSLTTEHNFTTGKVYSSVIEKERNGEYNGKTVQIIPHITNEIKRRIVKVANDSAADVLIIEIGGTVGDIESMPFLEAARQLWREVGKEENCMFIHTTLIPILGGEQKTKPTQHSVKELMTLGIKPDVIVGRSPEYMSEQIRQKISMFCDVPMEAVITTVNASSIYEVPLNLERQGLPDYIIKRLDLENIASGRDMKGWECFLRKVLEPSKEVNIAIVGKCVEVEDSYLSHKEALTHAGADADCRVNISFIKSEGLSKADMGIVFNNIHGIIIPGGSEEDCTEDKVTVARYARSNNIPFLGVGEGFHAAAIDVARDLAGMKGADSTEFNPCAKDPVITRLFDCMFLGSKTVELKKDSMVSRIYGTDRIRERFRHRFGINPEYMGKLEAAGLRFVGSSKDSEGEVAELKDHPFFLGCQFHPQFLSRPEEPSKLHAGLVKAAISYKK